MIRILRHWLFAALCLFASFAQAADGDVGIVLLHGKWDRPPTRIMALARQLESAGFRVVTPVMPWSGQREYDVPYVQALDEIDKAVNGLREKGASRIVVAGLSFGANGALAYAATGRPVDAIVALSPGHNPERGQFRLLVEPGVAKAKRMIDAGAGRDTASFDDLNQGKTRTLRVSAESYFSYFDPDGLGNMQKTAATWPKAIPLLMVVGTEDNMASVAEESIFKRAPGHAKSRYLSLAADHIGLLTVAGPDMIAWLRTLPDSTEERGAR